MDVPDSSGARTGAPPVVRLPPGANQPGARDGSPGSGAESAPNSARSTTEHHRWQRGSGSPRAAGCLPRLGLFRRYMACLRRGRYAVVATWLAILGLSIWLGPRFLSSTQMTFKAPPGTPAAAANAVMQSHFHAQATQSPLLVVVRSLRPGVGVVSPDDTFVCNLTAALNASMHALVASTPLLAPTGIYHGVVGYCPAVHGPLGPAAGAMVAGRFVSGDNATTLIALNVDNSVLSSDILLFLRGAKERIERLGNRDPERYSVGLTGADALFLDVLDGTTSDLVHTDSFIIPVALVILAWYIGSWRLMVIPLLSISISMLTSFALMLPLALYVWNVASFTPNVMMSLTIAMSVDYSMFLLTRFHEEVDAGRKVPDAVAVMLEHAGRIVLASGTTLAATFLGLVAFPMDFLRTIGFGAAVTLSVTMLVNVSLVPALILCAPRFFAVFGLPGWAASLRAAAWRGTLGRVGWCARRADSAARRRAAVAAGSVEAAREAQARSCWYKSAVWTTRPLGAVVTVLVVFGAFAPLCYYTTDLQTTSDAGQIFPRDSPALALFNQLKVDFSPGQIAPFYVAVLTNHTGGVFNSDFYTALGAFSKKLVSEGMAPSSGVTSIAYVDAQTVSYDEASAAWGIFKDRPEAILYRYLFASLTNDGKASDATLVELSVDFDPLGDCKPWVLKMRKLMADHMAVHSNHSLYLYGGNVQGVDAIDRVYALFPLVVASTSAVVFTLIAVLFRSLAVPMRVVVTIALPIAAVFGVGVLVFQRGGLDWLLPALRPVHAYYWLIPVMSFSILVGLGLDYDIFLFSRIFEYRRAGFTTTAAIRKGVHKTGSIVTGAGVVMALAFGGLMFSKEMALNQFGFLLSFAVLIDTFIVRTLLVPAIAALLGRANWWPGSACMVPATRGDADMDDAAAEGGGARREGGVAAGEGAAWKAADEETGLLYNDWYAESRQHGVN